MKEDYDFSDVESGAVIFTAKKTRLTIMLDIDVIAAFRRHAEKSDKDHHTLINETISNAFPSEPASDNQTGVRRVVQRALESIQKQSPKLG